MLAPRPALNLVKGCWYTCISADEEQAVPEALLDTIARASASSNPEADCEQNQH